MWEIAAGHFALMSIVSQNIYQLQLKICKILNMHVSSPNSFKSLKKKREENLIRN